MLNKKNRITIVKYFYFYIVYYYYNCKVFFFYNFYFNNFAKLSQIFIFYVIDYIILL